MHQASVGFHCPECVRQGRQQVYTARSLPGRGRPVVTITLIVINVAVFLADLAMGSAPGGGGTIDGLVLEGGLVSLVVAPDGSVIGVEAGEWYRIITSGFLHDGLVHLGFNMLVLWLLGEMLEPAVGRLRFALIYAVGLLAGSFGVLLLGPNDFTVGASGAVFGLFGAAVVVQRSQGINPFATGLGGLILINLIITFTLPGISIGGHVGGLIGGAVAALLLVELPDRLSSAPAGGAGASSAARVVPVASTVALGVALYAGCLWAAGQWMTGGVL